MRRRASLFVLPLLLCLVVFLPFSVVAQDSGAARDAWQRPTEVMDALGIRAGSRVADVGSGSGYFTFHLAERVGATGKVYAVDIDDSDLARIRRRAEREGLAQIETIRGATDNPHLASASVDVVLVVNAYHEMRDYDAMLAGLYRALAPGGRLGLIDAATDAGQPRSTYYSRHRIPAALVREDAVRAGFRFVEERPGFVRPNRRKEFYFLIFEKP